MAHQQPAGRQTLSFLRQSQRLQQMIGRRRAEALGNPFEKHPRSFGARVQKRRGGGEREGARVDRPDKRQPPNSASSRNPDWRLGSAKARDNRSAQTAASLVVSEAKSESCGEARMNEPPIPG